MELTKLWTSHFKNADLQRLNSTASRFLFIPYPIFLVIFGIIGILVIVIDLLGIRNRLNRKIVLKWLKNGLNF